MPTDKLSDMDQRPPYHLEVEGLEESGADELCQVSIRDRPWVGIHFDCCFVYTRIYRNASGTAYAGRCPRCMRKVSLRVGPGGTDARFFIAE